MTEIAYRTLGRSGLAVSPLALGTMTFGRERWGTDEKTSRGIFEAYLECGGNFIDTADAYSGGKSEEMLGKFVRDLQVRDRVVLATKTGFSSGEGSPFLGGNSAKRLNQAVDASLQRLQTDYIDLMWIHVWDMVTPVEEVLHTLNRLIDAGKIRYFGLSNVPAWYAATMATLARTHSLSYPVALQMEYSLVERTIEREHVPAGQALGFGVVPWSPLGGGFLSGKYDRAAVAAASDKKDNKEKRRLLGENPLGRSKFTPRNWRLLTTLGSVAREADKAPAQIALVWLLGRPGVSSVLVGASSRKQLAENLEAQHIVLRPRWRERLDKASAPGAIYPYGIFTPRINRMVLGGCAVTPW